MLSHEDDFMPFLTDTKTGEAYTPGTVSVKASLFIRLYNEVYNNSEMAYYNQSVSLEELLRFSIFYTLCSYCSFELEVCFIVAGQFVGYCEELAGTATWGGQLEVGFLSFFILKCLRLAKNM